MPPRHRFPRGDRLDFLVHLPLNARCSACSSASGIQRTRSCPSGRRRLRQFEACRLVIGPGSGCQEQSRARNSSVAKGVGDAVRGQRSLKYAASPTSAQPLPALFRMNLDVAAEAANLFNRPRRPPVSRRDKRPARISRRYAPGTSPRTVSSKRCEGQPTKSRPRCRWSGSCRRSLKHAVPEAVGRQISQP